MKTKYLDIIPSRWPWMDGYNWKGRGNPTAPLNSNGARFGGGWEYCLGVDMSFGKGYYTFLFNLLFGMIKVKIRTPKYYKS